MGNGFGPKTYNFIANDLIPSDGLVMIKKLIFKDPNPYKLSYASIQNMFQSLNNNCYKL